MADPNGLEVETKRIRVKGLVLWWKGGVGRNGVSVAHPPEPVVSFMVEGRGGEERCSSRTRTGVNSISTGGRVGWGRMVFFSHTHRSQLYFVDSYDSCVFSSYSLYFRP
jgi:hypothetical protein